MMLKLNLTPLYILEPKEMDMVQTLNQPMLFRVTTDNQVYGGYYNGAGSDQSMQNQAIWLAFMPNGALNSGYSGWAEFSFNNVGAVLGAVAFATSGDIVIGNTGNGLYTPVVLQDVSTAAVPEPSQVAASLLLAAGIAGFVIVKRRKEGSETLAA